MGCCSCTFLLPVATTKTRRSDLLLAPPSSRSYGLFSVIPIIFQGNRGFNPGESGLVFIGVGLGTTIGAAVSVWTQRGYPELLRKWHGHPPPEHR
jgi:hypothetical protein